MALLTNGGIFESHMKGDIANYGSVWFNENSLANILSLSEVRKRCRITMDTDVEPAIFVHRSDGSSMKFIEYKSGLYYYEVKMDNHNNNEVSDYCFVNTIAYNKKMFSNREIKMAEKAIELYAILKRPGQKRFEFLLAHNLIMNCPVSFLSPTFTHSKVNQQRPNRLPFHLLYQSYFRHTFFSIIRT